MNRCMSANFDRLWHLILFVLSNYEITNIPYYAIVRHELELMLSTPSYVHLDVFDIRRNGKHLDIAENKRNNNKINGKYLHNILYKLHNNVQYYTMRKTEKRERTRKVIHQR